MRTALSYPSTYPLKWVLTSYGTRIHYGIFLNGKLYTQIKEYNNRVNYLGAVTTVIVNL